MMKGEGHRSVCINHYSVSIDKSPVEVSNCHCQVSLSLTSVNSLAFSDNINTWAKCWEREMWARGWLLINCSHSQDPGKVWYMMYNRGPVHCTALYTFIPTLTGHLDWHSGAEANPVYSTGIIGLIKPTFQQININIYLKIYPLDFPFGKQ